MVRKIQHRLSITGLKLRCESKTGLHQYHFQARGSQLIELMEAKPAAAGSELEQIAGATVVLSAC